MLWFDALVGNVDRTWRNPNLLYWHGRLHMIDHGATLTFQHSWAGAERWATRPYDARDHVLVGCRPDVAAGDAALAPLVTDDVLRAAVADVPERWLLDEAVPPDLRAAYAAQMRSRLDARPSWVPELVAAAAAGTADRSPRRRPDLHWLGDR